MLAIRDLFYDISRKERNMRHITVSVLSLLVIMPALADARLPVVNIASGGVSARAAFGEAPVVKKKVVETPKIAKAEVKPETEKKVVARSSTKVAKNANASADSGEQILASSDTLNPRRPSSDLWARVDTPLRLPEPQEFSVYRSDASLPEESLDDRSTLVARSQKIEAPVETGGYEEDFADFQEPMSQLDAQIARLTELQRKAEESVRATAGPIETRKVVAMREPRMVVSSSQESRHQSNSSIAQAQPKQETVNLSRMVVPMEEEQDVVVRAVKKSENPTIATVRNDMTSMSPTELRKAFRKTFLSENKHLSTFQIDDRFDVASDMSANMEGFTSRRDLSEAGGIRPLEIKIKFRNDDAALSRDNYNLLTEYAGIVLSNPTRAIQVSIPEQATRTADSRKLTARRLAIVEQVLRDMGISEYRIMPVLSQRKEEGFVLRMMSMDQYDTLTQQKRDIFGDTISKKSYKSMTW